MANEQDFLRCAFFCNNHLQFLLLSFWISDVGATSQLVNLQEYWDNEIGNCVIFCHLIRENQYSLISEKISLYKATLHFTWGAIFPKWGQTWEAQPHFIGLEQPGIARKTIIAKELTCNFWASVKIQTRMTEELSGNQLIGHQINGCNQNLLICHS